MATPVEQLADTQLLRSVEFVVGLLNSAHYQVQMPKTMTAKNLGRDAYGACGSNVFDGRVYAPADIAAAKRMLQSPRSDFHVYRVVALPSGCDSSKTNYKKQDAYATSDSRNLDIVVAIEP